MLRLNFYWLLIPLLAVCASAQTGVEGIIHDATGKSAAGARVVLRRLENNHPQGTRSDAAGRFRFGVVEAGDQKLTIDADGFYAPSRTVGGDLKLHV